MDKISQVSYRQVFKSTFLVGGTQVINLAIGLLRTKVLAVLLGAGGIGLAGMYTSAVALVGTITGLGIASAGVRQIAEAVGTGDDSRVSVTIRTLRRASLVSGLAGMLVTILLCFQLSYLTFGNRDYGLEIAVVSLTIFFGALSAGQTALLQGLRKLKILAKCNIMGALLGTIASIIIVFRLREDGIAFYLVAVSALAAASSWWYARKVPIKQVPVSRTETIREARGLLAMGAAFMTSALFVAGANYIIRVIVERDFGLEAVGLYTAAVTLSALYVGMVLSAMGADFYPRLAAVGTDHVTVNRLVNEQTEMGVIMALPGVLATITFAPWVLRLFYSEAFVGAADIVRWQILGVALRVISWPMAFVAVAKGMSRLYMASELGFNVLHVILVLICMHAWGFEGIGIASFLSYAGYLIGMRLMCGQVTRYAWTRRARLLIVISVISVALLLALLQWAPQLPGVAFGSILTAISAIVCLGILQKLLGYNLVRVNPWRNKAPQ